MSKTTFTVAAIAAVAQAVNTQQWMSASLKTFLAQVEQSNTKHSCSHAMDINKGSYVDFDTVSVQNTPWTDTDFPTNDGLYWKDHEAETEFVAYLPEDVTWKRISEAKIGVESLWGPNGSSDIKPADMNQGGVGNCWIISAISAVAEVPGRVTNLMLNDDLNDAGVYGVNMYSLGVPTTVYVDDYLPVAEDWYSGGSKPLYAGLGKDNSIWGAIVEKAFAKKYGNYQHTEGGWMATGVANLNGSPFRTHMNKDYSEDDLWAILETHDLAVDVMTAGTENGPDTPAGLASGHAYTIIGVATLDDGDRLIKCRNPWGSEQYTGPWSDNDSRWTPELRAEVNEKLGGGSVVADDGIFFTDIKTYQSNFTETQINFDTSDWSFGSWLMLDDSSNGQHTIKITNDSDSAQNIHVGSHIWQDRTYSWYNDDCFGATDWQSPKNFSITCNESDASANFNLEYGSAWLNPIEFAAGETKEFSVSMDWARQGIVKDFSVTAWGEGGAVTVAHADGTASASLPIYGMARPDDADEEDGDDEEQDGDDQDGDDQDGGDDDQDQDDGDEEDQDDGDDADEDDWDNDDYGEYYCEGDDDCVCDPEIWWQDTEGNEKWDCYGDYDDEQDGDDADDDDYSWEDEYYCDADAGCVCDPVEYGQDTDGNFKWNCYGDEQDGGDDENDDDYSWEDEYCDADAGCVCDPTEYGQDTEGNQKWNCYGDEQDGDDDDYSWEDDDYYCDTDPDCVCDPEIWWQDTEGNEKWDCYGDYDDEQDGGDDDEDWDTDYGEQTWECSAENDCQTVDGDYFMMCCADPYGDNTEVAECDAENDCQTVDGDYFMGCCADGGDIDYEEDDYDWEDEYYCDADAGCVCDPVEYGQDTEGNFKWNCYGDEAEYDWDSDEWEY